MPGVALAKPPASVALTESFTAVGGMFTAKVGLNSDVFPAESVAVAVNRSEADKPRPVTSRLELAGKLPFASVVRKPRKVLPEPPASLMNTSARTFAKVCWPGAEPT